MVGEGEGEEDDRVAAYHHSGVTVATGNRDEYASVSVFVFVLGGFCLGCRLVEPGAAAMIVRLLGYFACSRYSWCFSSNQWLPIEHGPHSTHRTYTAQARPRN